LRQSSWVVWLDLEEGTLAVEQDVELSNPGTTSFAGQGTAVGLPAGQHPVLRLPMAVGGTNLQFVGQFVGCCTAVDRDGVVLSQVVKPGTSQGTVRYELPFTSRLELAVPLPTDSLVVLVSPRLRLDARQLSVSGTSSDRGITYQVYRASSLTPGTTIGLQLVLAPAERTARRWWAVGAVTGVPLLGALLFLLRRRRSAVRGRTPAQVLAERVAAERVAADRVADDQVADDRAMGRFRPPDSADAELLIEEIAMIDLAFDRGMVSDEAVYRRVRAAVLERLVAAEEEADRARPETSGRR
jgi:hypothetical protein